MKILTNEITVKEIKKIMEAQQDQPKNVRIFVAGVGCSGPTLGLSLDEKQENDLVDETNGVAFIMESALHEQMGDIKVEYMDGGYMVVPVVQQPSACSGCGGSCG